MKSGVYHRSGAAAPLSKTELTCLRDSILGGSRNDDEPNVVLKPVHEPH